jgi:flavin reductase (DIM6/NTAB) family NADH-FMN oxidoreductase RutF
MKTRLEPSGILFPVSASLVVSGSLEEPNSITVVWIGIMSSSPSTLAISLKKNRYSLELIRNTKEFTVNIPPSDKFK